MLRRLTVRGFKPLREVTVELPRLALLFGPNAAGKSNFLEAVQTLSWLGNACTLQDTLGAPYPVRRLPFEAFSLDSDGFATKAPAPEQRLDLPRNLGNARFAALRAAVPTGGRRSLTCAPAKPSSVVRFARGRGRCLSETGRPSLRAAMSQARSKRSRFMTLSQAATKSCASCSPPSSAP